MQRERHPGVGHVEGVGEGVAGLPRVRRTTSRTALAVAVAPIAVDRNSTVRAGHLAPSWTSTRPGRLRNDQLRTAGVIRTIPGFAVHRCLVLAPRPLRVGEERLAGAGNEGTSPRGRKWFDRRILAATRCPATIRPGIGSARDRDATSMRRAYRRARMLIDGYGDPMDLIRRLGIRPGGRFAFSTRRCASAMISGRFPNRPLSTVALR